MENKEHIQLSQSNIQDLIDCPRRFQLSTIDQISWPATPGEPISKIENLIETGNQFHALCNRFFTGIDPDLLAKDISNPELVALWNGFLPIGDDIQFQEGFPEVILTATIAGNKFTAKYDLVARDNQGRFTIYDWKTSTRPPSRATLENKAQSIIYPYLFVLAGPHLFRIPEISPSQVSMRYVYPLLPETDILFEYSENKHQEYSNKIKGWISYLNELVSTSPVFPLTETETICQSCRFRSICDRGNKPVDSSKIDEIDLEDLSGTHFDIGQISEINY